MSAPFSIAKLRQRDSMLGNLDEVAALVEIAEAVNELDGFPGHTWRCEFRTAAKGWKPGEPPIVECHCGLDRLEAALSRFDFGDGRAD